MIPFEIRFVNAVYTFSILNSWFVS